MTPPPAAPGAGRWIVILFGLALACAAIASGVWALSSRRTQLVSDVNARLGEVEAERASREAERAEDRQVVRDEAIAALGSLVLAASSDPDEVARLRGAQEVLAQMSAEHRAPTGTPPSKSLLATQPRFDLLPLHDAAEFEAVLTDKLAVMERVVAERSPPEADALAYLAFLRLHRGDGPGAIDAANRALLARPSMWLAWVVRGQARGADADLLVGDALCPRDPSWALLARADLAEARGDLALARDLCRQALEHVPARYGHAGALKRRLARLDAATRQ